MEFNKLVSLVLGFIVLVLLLVWAGGKIRSQNGAPLLSNKKIQVSVTPTFTPTPTPAKQATPTPTKKSWNPFGFLFNKPTVTPTAKPTPTIATTLDAKTTTPVVIVTATPSPVQQRNLGGKIMATSTPKVLPTATLGMGNAAQAPQTNTESNHPYNNKGGQGVVGVTQIPNTGAPTLLIPLALSSLIGGTYLSRLKKRS